MKVSELIEELFKLPPDMEIWVEDERGPIPVNEVEVRRPDVSDDAYEVAMLRQ